MVYQNCIHGLIYQIKKKGVQNMNIKIIKDNKILLDQFVIDYEIAFYNETIEIIYITLDNLKFNLSINNPDLKDTQIILYKKKD